MPRPTKDRAVSFLPEHTYFKPAGVPRRDLDEVILSVEELEALRLKDIQGLEQAEAAELMKVARTTFRRVLIDARAKVADALVNGKAIRIEGGNYQVVHRQFRCRRCGHGWETPYGTGETGSETDCPECGSPETQRADQGGRGFGRRWGRQRQTSAQEDEEAER
ncbi:MAG: DUF134 domain-containing protein [Bacillota bacterium]